MSGDALLVAALLARTAQGALAAALRADPASAARLHAAAASGERTLRIETTTPIAPDVRAVTLAVTSDGVGLRVEDPSPADATLAGPTSALLALMRDPAQLDAGTDIVCEGDREFALHVLVCLRALRPDPLLPLTELLGAGLPSALYTARAAIGSVASGAIAALRELAVRAGTTTSRPPGSQDDRGNGAG